MKRLLFFSLIVLLLAALVPSSFAQYVPTLAQPQSFALQINTASATSNGNVANLNGLYSVMGLTATGSFNSATFTPQVSNDNTTWTNAPCYSKNDDGFNLFNSSGWLTGTGNWACNTAGFSQFRVAINSGTPAGVNITGQASPIGTPKTAGVGSLLSQSSGVMAIRTAQTTAPTCSANCGTSPGVVGSDTSSIITIGTTPVNPITVTFNGTWAAAPSCIAEEQTTAANAVQKVATTTTTAVITFTAGPTAADKVSLLCIGVQ